jgi:FixJ family two-component response regulator
MTVSRRTIAVVDDDAGIRAALADLLHAADFDARTFGSAEEFLERGLAESIDGLVADIHLPGMTGVALLRELGARGRAIPAVLVTGRHDPATRELIRRAESVPCLRKPFGDAELFDALRRVMGA